MTRAGVKRLWSLASCGSMIAMTVSLITPESAAGSSRLTKERVLAAAEEVMLSHGPDKATVVDVARALGVNHANVYKFFGSKADLRRAVVQAWLDRMDSGLPGIVAQRAAPTASDGATGLWSAVRWTRHLGHRPDCTTGSREGLGLGALRGLRSGRRPA